MRSTIPRQSSTALLRPRVWLCAIFLALATFLLSAGSAHADTLPNQGSIDSALKELSEAEQEARDNIPGNSRMKEAEDALDAAKRANDDTPSNNHTAKAEAEAAQADAQAAADNLQNEMKGRTTDFMKDRAKKYREALDKRRAARKKLRALLAEIRNWFGRRRAGIGGTKELEDAINHLRSRVGQSGQTLTPQSTAALTPFTPLSTNVAYDGQTYCTFGKADPTKVALAPSDDSGNPLSGKMLASLPLMAPGGPKVPANGGNPENQPKTDKPQGGNTSKPQGPTTTAPQGDGAQQGSPSTGSKPPATGANSSGPSTAPPAENPDVPTGRGGLADALGILTGENEKAGTNIPAPPAPPEGPASGKSVLDNIDELLEIFERERKSGKTATPGGTMPLGAGLLPTDLSQAGVTSKGSGEYAPSTGASLEPMPAPGSGPQIDPEMLKPAWERNPWPTPKPTGPKTAAPQNGSTSAPQEPLSPPAGGQKPITGTSSLPGAASGAALAEILAGRNSPTHGGSSGGALSGPSVSQQSHLDQPLLSEGNLPSGESILDEIDDSQYPGPPGYPTGNVPWEENFEKWLGEWIRDRQALGTSAPKFSGLTPWEKFIFYHQYLRERLQQSSASPAQDPMQKSSGKPESAGKTQTSATPASKEKQPIEKSSSAATPVSALSPNPGAGDITIHFKATESVLQAGSQSTEVKTQIVKLIPSEIPDLPKTGGSKTEKAALDEGHDASPVTCALGKSGKCKAQMSGSQRKVYGLPDNALSNYAADLNLKQNTGGVLQGESPAGVHGGTSAGTPNAAGAQVITSKFKIGNQAFTRISVASADPAAGAAMLASLGKTFGAKFETDHCGEKKPGPPLGMEPVSFSALGRELPQAALTLRTAAPAAGGVR